MLLPVSNQKPALETGRPSCGPPKLKMRVLLQNRDTRLYLARADEWTPEIDAAENFGQIVTALEFVRDHRQAHLDVLMIFGEPRYDVRIFATP